MNSWQAFRAGLARATRYWQVWLILYAANLVGALLLALLPALTMISDPGHSPAIRQAADGLDAWYLIEMLMSPDATLPPGQVASEPGLTPAFQQLLILGLVTLVALPWLAWLPASFLSGGLLLVYAESPRPYRWRRFLWGCWHWFGTCLLLGVIQVLGLMISLIPAAVLMVAAPSIGNWLVWFLVLAVGLWILLWSVLLEYSRIAAVVGETQNAFRALGQGLRFVFHHLWAVAGLYAATLLLAAALHALFRLGLMPYLRLDWWPLVLIVQQAFILARLCTRLIRLGGATALVADAIQPPPSQGPTGPPSAKTRS